MSISNTDAVTRMTLEYIIAGVAIEWLDPHLGPFVPSNQRNLALD